MTTIRASSTRASSPAPASRAARNQAWSTLVRTLQGAHAGERAAALAYRGHWRSIRNDPAVRAEIARIEQAEWHHRAVVGDLLTRLGSAPRPPRELLLHTIGRFFGALCFVTPRVGPMFAAGRLEATNVDQYGAARDAATVLGLERVVADLDEMMAEERRHESFFAEQCRHHPLARLAGRFLGWDPEVAATPVADLASRAAAGSTEHRPAAA